MYYNTQSQQIVPRNNVPLLKRPKAAIPIVPPPEKGGDRSSKEGESYDESQSSEGNQYYESSVTPDDNRGTDDGTDSVNSENERDTTTERRETELQRCSDSASEADERPVSTECQETEQTSQPDAPPAETAAGSIAVS